MFVYLLDMKELKYGKETREEIISKKTFNRKFWNMRMVVVSTAAMTWKAANDVYFLTFMIFPKNAITLYFNVN